LEKRFTADSITSPIDVHHVEIFAIVIVPSLLCHTSPQKAKSLGDAKAPVMTLIDGHHVEVSVTVGIPSTSRHTSHWKAKSLWDAKALLPDNDTLVLQNHFSSLDSLQTTDARGDPYTVTSIILTAIAEFNYEHVTVEN